MEEVSFEMAIGAALGLALPPILAALYLGRGMVKWSLAWLVSGFLADGIVGAWYGSPWGYVAAIPFAMDVWVGYDWCARVFKDRQ